MGSNRWGEDVDYEAKELKEFKVKFTINFKKIFFYVGEVSERTLEVTDKHPKDSLMLLWGGTLLGLFIFFALSYQLFIVITLPIIVFYVIALIRIFKCWSSVGYSKSKFWLMTIPAILGTAGIAFGLQQLFVHLVIIK